MKQIHQGLVTLLAVAVGLRLAAWLVGPALQPLITLVAISTVVGLVMGRRGLL